MANLKSLRWRISRWFTPLQIQTNSKEVPIPKARHMKASGFVVTNRARPPRKVVNHDIATALLVPSCVCQATLCGCLGDGLPWVLRSKLVQMRATGRFHLCRFVGNRVPFNIGPTGVLCGRVCFLFGPWLILKGEPKESHHFGIWVTGAHWFRSFAAGCRPSRRAP